MQKRDNRCTEAITTFNRFFAFLESPESSALEDKNRINIQALIEQEGCYMATGKLSAPQRDYQFTLLPEEVNSPYNDFAPQPYQSDTVLVIASGRPAATGHLIDNIYGEDFPDNFRLIKAPKGWKDWGGKDHFGQLNTDFSEGSGSFTADFRKFYFSSCAGEGCQIFVSARNEKGDWQSPVLLNENINLAGTHAKQPCISPTGDTLFFVSDREKGYGQNDIWYSLANGKDDWGPAMNAGRKVNTPFNEVSPFFDARKGMFYFASNGHQGFGGLDVFVAGGKTWQSMEIMNIGAPFNSNRDDAFFVLGQNHGFMASNRDGGKGKFDIYQFLIEPQEQVIIPIDLKLGQAGHYLMTPGHLAYYHIAPDERESFERVLSSKMVSEVHGTQLPLSQGDYEFYQTLDPENRQMLDRVIDARLRNMTSSDLQAMREEDMFIYDQLSDETKSQVNRMIAVLGQSKGQKVLALDEESQQFYEQLDPDEKYAVDRVLSSRLRNLSTSELYAIREEDNFYYSNLSSSEKQKLDRIIAVYDVARYSGNGAVLSAADEAYVNNLPPEEKAIVNRLISSRLRNLSSSNAYAIREEDKFFYESLDTEEKARVNRIVAIYNAAKNSGISATLSREMRSLWPSFPPTKSRRWIALSNRACVT
ncbi:MAG: hypothetical protein HC842_01090, partial [Cytophagales bacterium]|nr:hypothetical protein [Cytophagales bacterium]